MSIQKLSKILFLILSFTLVIFSQGCNSSPDKTTGKVYENNSKPEADKFGIYSDSLNTFSAKVRKNENLADLLLPFNVSYKQVMAIVSKSAAIFNVRKIKRQNNYHVYFTPDSLHKLRYFVYEKDPLNYIVISINKDSINVREGAKKLKIVKKATYGVIKNSLYETLDQQNLPPMLAIKLSEIFAWQIDFYRLQKGDKFKVIYDEKYIDGEPVGIGKILAAYFQKKSKKYWAFYFKQDGKNEYFDEDGGSLQKEFLIAPIKFARISSRFSRRRFHPILKKFKAHFGTDYAAKYGTPIMSTGDGIVIKAKYNKYNGNYVKIRHNSIYTTQYLHMSRFAKGIKLGVKVKQGQIIGYVGSTGLATGPHVCYRFWKNSKQVNSLKEKFPSSHPVKKGNILKFTAVKNQFIQELDNIKFPHS